MAVAYLKLGTPRPNSNQDSGVSYCPTARRSQGVSQSPTTILLPASQGLERE
ncbi:MULTISPECIES: hypothetical protein [Moorena]|uniref:hypothetical protein n=1 Tax=Moorena TaxID=1155738 RepID=UPI0002EAD426|nr:MULTISPECIES: hypothetical protein [Moorena]NET66628.1 hypothetical protein [Moorena sp. SIO1G6]